MVNFETWKKSLESKEITVLDKMLQIKKIALTKKTMKIDGKLYCEEGGKQTWICGAELQGKDPKRLKKEMTKPQGQLENEIQAITEEIHSRGELTAEELELKKSSEQPTLKF
tara:strand:+ start:806 stop:1141 length:336 start_codon:yes stop_codon:yes gene_type:complete